MVDIEPQVYTVEQVCRILQLSRNSVYTQIAQGKIPSLRFGKRLVVPKAKLEKLLNGEANNGTG
jgi:excisionase family DNA binding protein